MRKNVIVVYGGRSAEHDVSLKTAAAVMNGLNKDNYEVYPVYITEEGVWRCGEKMQEKWSDPEQLRLVGREQGGGTLDTAQDGSDTAGIVQAPEQAAGRASGGRSDRGTERAARGGTAAGMTGVAASLTAATSAAEAVEASAGQVARSIGNVLSLQLFQTPGTVVFPVLHGPGGEDGTLQGMLDMLLVPYVGNGVLSSAAGLDKVVMKQLLAQAHIPSADYAELRRETWETVQEPARLLAELERTIGYPCYVKPANLGSSIGISRCESRMELLAAVEKAFRYDRKLLVEKEVRGREVQLAVLGNEHPVCSVAGEFVREAEFFSYRHKYMAGRLVKRIPAELTEEVEGQLRWLALKTYRLLEGSGLMRIDFFVTDNQGIYLNEVNTLPGFTENSMYPALWEATDGTAFPELLDKLIGLALERHERRKQILHRRDEA